MMPKRKPPTVNSAPPGQGPMTLPEAERGRPPAEVARWEKARAELTNPRLPLTERQREAKLRTIARIEAAPAERAERLWQAEAAEETVRLAETRGEKVERSKVGALRNRDHDPLLSLLEGGHLTAEEHGVGIKVRDLYDLRNAGTGSQLAAFTGAGGGHDNDRFVHSRLRVAKASKQVRDIEVAVAFCGEPDALAMMRAVCERGLSLSSQGRGRAFEWHARSLAKALRIAGDVLRGRLAGPVA